MMNKFNWQEQVCFERMNRLLFLENVNCKDFKRQVLAEESTGMDKNNQKIN